MMEVKKNIVINQFLVAHTGINGGVPQIKAWMFALLVLLLSIVGIGGGAAVACQKIIVERKPKFLTAGPGLRPYDVTRHLIPLNQIQSGGPSRDQIPALFYPAFISSAAGGRLLKKSERVLGVFWNGQAKAYPVRILNWHELVNDTIGGRPILVSWCPLCGSGVVYDAVIQGKRFQFGVTGKLYQRNMVLYDRQTYSLWSQLLSEAVTGPMAGTRLQVLPIAVNTTWAAWVKDQPETLVLSFHTGYRRDYSMDPYAMWNFPRQPALVVSAGGATKIYPYSELKKAGGEVVDHIGRQTIHIVYHRQARSARVVGEGGVVWFQSYLDDARQFYPRAKVYRGKKK